MAFTHRCAVYFVESLTYVAVCVCVCEMFPLRMLIDTPKREKRSENAIAMPSFIFISCLLYTPESNSRIYEEPE